MVLLYSFLCLFLLKISSISSYKTTCLIKENELMEIQNDLVVEITIHIDDFFFDDYPADDVEVVILKYPNINFSGPFLRLNSNETSEVDDNFSVESVTVQRNLTDEDGSTCEISPLPISLGLPEKIETAVTPLVTHCMLSSLCEQYNTLVSNLDCHRTLTNGLLIQFQQNVYDYPHNTQDAVNTLTDCTISSIVSEYLPFYSNVINLGDIKLDLYDADFLGINGTMEGLESLIRITDVDFKTENSQFLVSAQYKIPNITVKFDEYQGTFVISTSGNFSVTTTEISIELSIAFDFNTELCESNLTQFDIQHKTLDVEMTGFTYAFNKAASSFFSGFLAKYVHDSSKGIVENMIKTIDCEKFRQFSN